MSDDAVIGDDRSPVKAKTKIKAKGLRAGVPWRYIPAAVLITMGTAFSTLATLAIGIHLNGRLAGKVPWSEDVLTPMILMDLSGFAWIFSGLEIKRRRIVPGLALLGIAWTVGFGAQLLLSFTR